jgi:hypothetical protein
MQNYFEFLTAEEISNLEMLDFSNNGGSIKIFGKKLNFGEIGNGLYLDFANFDKSQKSKFTSRNEFQSGIEYCTFDRNFNLCYVVNARGQLAVINLDKNLIKVVNDFEKNVRNMQITGIISTKNCSKLLATGNISSWRSDVSGNRSCTIKLFKEKIDGKQDRQILEFDFPHLFESTHGCVTSFSQDTVFIIGRNDRFANLVALDFKSDDLIFQNDYMKPDEQFKFIDRLPGTNVLVL